LRGSRAFLSIRILGLVFELDFLPRTIGPVLLIDEMKRLRAIMQGGYPEFATISDDTSAGAEIEAV
jgi:hypothetical protein